MPATVLRDVLGLQAQVLSAAALGLRARSRGLRSEAVTTAINERSIVRTWLMRGTLHLVATDDIDLLLGLLGPVFAAGNQARHRQLGLDPELKRRGVAAIRDILAEAGPLTRYEIVDRLRGHGIVLDPKTQAPIHLIGYAALQGVLCLGPDRENGEPTYVLIDDWLGRPIAGSTRSAPGELARRYFAAYGPATLDDLVAWSGLPMAQARAAVAMALPAPVDVTVEGHACLVLKDRIENLRRPWPSAPARLSQPRPDRSRRAGAALAARRRVASPGRGGRRARDRRLDAAPERWAR